MTQMKQRRKRGPKSEESYDCPKCGEKNALRRAGWRVISGKRVRQYAHETYINGGRQYCYSTVNPSAPWRGENRKPKRQKDNKPRKPFRRPLESRRIIFTAAQNATPVHEGFWNALKALAKDIGAELAVIPLRYKNPTSTFTASQKNEEHWLRDLAERELAAKGVTREKFYKARARGEPTLYKDWTERLDAYARRYLYEQRKKFNDNLVVVGDVKTQPTAADPLTGLEGLTHGESGIFGHTKLRMKCIPTPQNRMPKILTTTGACTIENYTDTPTGKKGAFHHVLGAVLVEIESRSKFHLHHINATRKGQFIFKRKRYDQAGQVHAAERDRAMIFGDAHYRFADPQVVEATFGKGGLVDVHDPEVLVWHDLLDAYSVNPHHGKNPFIKKAKHEANYHVVRAEVEETVEWMSRLGAGRENYVVASNHDDMLARWIIRADWKEEDPANMEFYLETALQMARSARMSEVGAEYLDPFGYWVHKLAPENVKALRANQHFQIAGIELSYHGDDGPKGARGTVKNLSKIGTKLISGHGHAPEIFNGHTRVGTMTRLTAEYVTGPNDWLNAHATIDALGKRHLHFCIDGKFYMEN